MNSVAILSIGTILIAVLTLFILLFVKKKEKFSFKNTFVFDYFSKGKTPISFILIYILFVTSIAATQFYGLWVYHTILNTIGAIILSLGTLLLIPMYFLNEKNMKISIIFSYIFFFLTALGSLITAIGGVYEAQVIESPDFPLFLSICYFVISGITVASLINPKLWNPTFFDKWEKEGTTLYLRTKMNWVSIYQWSYILILLLQVILILISSFFMDVKEPVLPPSGLI